MSNNLKFLIKLFVSVAFITWAIFFVDWNEIALQLKKIKLGYIALYYIFYFLGLVISSYKWKKLLEYKDISIGLKKAFQLYFTGTLINNFFPSFIGGDTYRAINAVQNQSVQKSTASVVADRLTGFMAAIILAIIFGAINYKNYFDSPILMLIFLALVGVTIGLVVIYVLRKHPIIEKLFARLKKGRELLKEIHFYISHKEAFLKALSWSGVFALVGMALSNLILFYALGINIDLLNYFSVIFLISIVSAIPVSVNNIGIKEWAYVTFFAHFGLANTAVLAVAILSRVLQMIASMGAFPFYLKTKK